MFFQGPLKYLLLSTNKAKIAINWLHTFHRTKHISHLHQNHFRQICSFSLSPTSFLKRKSSRELISSKPIVWDRVTPKSFLPGSMVLPNPLLSVIRDSIIHEGLSPGLTVCKLLANLHMGNGLMSVLFLRMCVCAHSPQHV